MKTNIIHYLIIAFFAAMNVEAQSPTSKDIVDVSATLAGDKVLVLEIKLDIKDGWHINSNKPFDEYLTPTSVSLKDSSAFSEIKTEYPVPEIIQLEFSQTDLSLYQNQVVVKIMVTPKTEINKKDFIIEGNVFYQPCNNKTCLFPVKKQFRAIYKSE